MALALQVMHSLPGRIRIKIPASNLSENRIEAICRKNPAIYSASFSRITSSVLIYYKPQTPVTEILDYLSALFPSQVEVYDKINSKVIDNFLGDHQGELKRNLLAVGVFLVQRVFFPGISANRLLNPRQYCYFNCSQWHNSKRGR